jgi:ABC-type multidrug transport system ATPase subunit
MLMDEEINFLVLDEPTNHLDIASREWIEEAVEAYEGALLFVSHDRYFISRFATRVWELENGVVTDYPVTFPRYKEIKERQAAQPKPEKKESTPKAPPKGGRAQQAARRQLTICERDLAKLEEESKALDAQLEAAACDYERYSALYADKQALEEKLAALMERWEQLALEAEEEA